MIALGFDTSNYTTSVALYDSEKNDVIHKKQLLKVEKGNKGLRQSECVFQHTVNLPCIIEELFHQTDSSVGAVGASILPRLVKESYMPCFLVGKSAAVCASKIASIPFYSTSHQHGHIAAALYDSNLLNLIGQEFIAFHLSGGTTEVLLVKPDSDEIFNINRIAGSLDLNAGQLIDRTGVLLGLQFPCGAELDRLSQESDALFNIKPTLKGNDCCLSGVENRVLSMIEKSTPPEIVADYCITYIVETLERMTAGILKEHGDLPLIFVGGVSSNSKIQSFFKNKYDAKFASAEFSTDNAAGVAILTAFKFNNDNFNSQSA